MLSGYATVSLKKTAQPYHVLSSVFSPLSSDCEVEQCLREHSPDCDAQTRIGAVAFIHRFGSSLNEHVHFHCCIVDGVFETAADTGNGAGVDFHAATGLDAATVAGVQARVRRQVLRTFVRRGLIDKGDAEVMGGWVHGGGFSVDASVCINEKDRAGLERLLRYCARPPFALEHLQKLDAEHLVYHIRGQRTEDREQNLVRYAGLSNKSVAKPHHDLSSVFCLLSSDSYFGVLAPNSPLRAAVIALAPVAVVVPPLTDSAGTEEKPSRSVSHYLWAMQLARIYEAFPLICPICHAQMRIIAFINEAGDVRKILDHIGESTQPPRIAPARGPPLWELVEASAQAGNDPEWDTAEPEPEIEFDQSVA